MKLTLALKLQTTPEQFDALRETVEAFNRGCNYVAQEAFARHTANKIALQPLVYGRLREEFGLGAQAAVRCISKTCEAYKRDRSIQPVFDPHGAMVYDERIMHIKDAAHVSLWTLQGRILVAMQYGAYQSARIALQKGQADLLLKDGVFYLYVCIDLPTPPPIETTSYLGVDLGIVEVATDSDGNQYSGETVKAIRARVKKHRGCLQQRATHSAKKRLRKIARRQSRFVRDVNHCISKKLVQTAVQLQKAIGMEDLSGIRDRVSVSKTMRWLMGNWAFDQLKQFVMYKAEMAGLRVVAVDPRNTSRECSACGYIDKGNRKTQAQFKCLNPDCNFECNADLNAAIVIGKRASQSERLLSSALATG